MIQIELIRNYFPAHIRNNSIFNKYILKEYIQLLILDWLSSTRYIRKMTFIGGSNLRLVKGFDRFSEALDFDCESFSKEVFIEMSNSVLKFLRNNGLRAEVKDCENSNLTAFRRNIHFPELLFDLGLTGHREDRFLMKPESQDQGIDYQPIIANIKGCGFFFPFPVPPDAVLCSMKISAMLSRQKGRDFYDVMFMLSQTAPDYNFLSKRCGVSNLVELKQATTKMLQSADLNKKMRDFEHLLFNKNKSEKILQIGSFIDELS